MRALIPAVLAFIVAAASLTTGQEPIFRSSTRIVPVVATVVDDQGRFVPGLEQDQFTILDNGVPQNITFFQNDVQPFTAVVMLDYSASMTANLDRLQAASPENITFAWAGSMEPQRPHYYRLQGPTFLMEHDNSRNRGTHIHSVWRDFAEDFGQSF